MDVGEVAKWAGGTVLALVGALKWFADWSVRKEVSREDMIQKERTRADVAQKETIETLRAQVIELQKDIEAMENAPCAVRGCPLRKPVRRA